MCKCSVIPGLIHTITYLLTKVLSGSCWDSEEDSMVVRNQSQAPLHCMSVKREKNVLTCGLNFYLNFI